MHLHKFGKWQDVKVGDELKFPAGWPYPITRQTIKQQRRCSICNLVKTRST